MLSTASQVLRAHEVMQRQAALCQDSFVNEASLDEEKESR